MPNATQPMPCPSWCDRRHLANWTVHSLELGSVAVGAHTIAVDLHRWADNDGPVVTVTRTNAGRSTALDLTVNAANLLSAMLADAVQLASNDTPAVTS